ncbi:sigma-70 family RNA polymerase sigma factor [uncultured Chitinophaga sp.]|uniref:RNA polymerase sigma factor n=1 Tax=uncultured Chitinophaga sp. TaxID=339340 RepID=UPI0025EDA31A|nr:sigma-70 family RNA polymerase sigma factor [uncultured Chitinophaga sp.]
MEKEFMDLVNDHRALIFKVCNLYCQDAGSRNDLFQEIVLQLWKSYPSFRKQSAGSTWIYRVALNTAISNFRKQQKSPGSSSLDEMGFDIPDMHPSAMQQEQVDALYEAIQQLSEIEKAIILLYLDEKSYEEISAIMGITLSNVGVRLNRIKQKLTHLIKSKQHGA